MRQCQLLPVGIRVKLHKYLVENWQMIFKTGTAPPYRCRLSLTTLQTHATVCQSELLCVSGRWQIALLQPHCLHNSLPFSFPAGLMNVIMQSCKCHPMECNTKTTRQAFSASCIFQHNVWKSIKRVSYFSTCKHWSECNRWLWMNSLYIYFARKCCKMRHFWWLSSIVMKHGNNSLS